MDISVLLITVIILALVFDFINGFHDSANAIATVVSTRAMKPLHALVYAGILNLLGAMLGTKVAATIGSGLVEVTSITLTTLLFTMLGAICWNLLTWYQGLPTSSSHALVGSLLGASYFSKAAAGHDIYWHSVINKVVLPMVTSPVLGIALGIAIMTGLTWLIWRMNPARINRLFGKLQIVSAGFMALNHGLNDAQKSMGIIALALLLAFPQTAFTVPLWVKVACAVTMALGTLVGGKRIIRTLGSKITHLQPPQGFAAETSASIIIAGASYLGIPVSTTQVISTSILGVGATKRFSAVRWGIVGHIIWAWVLTLPLTFLFSGVLVVVYEWLTH